MDQAEINDRLKNVISSIIKDDPEAAKRELHDVLAAKMRARIEPEGTPADDASSTPADDAASTPADDTSAATPAPTPAPAAE